MTLACAFAKLDKVEIPASVVISEFNPATVLTFAIFWPTTSISELASFKSLATVSISDTASFKSSATFWTSAIFVATVFTEAMLVATVLIFVEFEFAVVIADRLLATFVTCVEIPATVFMFGKLVEINPLFTASLLLTGSATFLILLFCAS